MDLQQLPGYLTMALPLLAYAAFLVVMHVGQRRLGALAALKVPLHLAALGLLLRVGAANLPTPWPARLLPYSEALIIFAGVVLIIRAVDAIGVGYLLARLQKRHVPHILRQGAILLADFIAALIVLRQYLNLDVTSLVATSAVVSFVVGLASQDLLGSVLAGLVIGVERPIAHGNWVNVNGMEGRVVDVTWRRTRIETRDGDFILLPNNVVMKDTVTNYTLPSPLHRVRVEVGAHYRHPPNQVKAAMIAAARQCPEVLAEPAPSVFLESFGDSSINYRLNAWTMDYGRQEAIRDEVNCLIWYQFQREGIEIPFPIRTLVAPPPEPSAHEQRQDQIERIVPLLLDSEVFQGVSAPDLLAVADRMNLLTFGAGEMLFNEGDHGDSLYLLAQGRAQVIKRTPEGGQALLATLEEGQCLGEMALLLGLPRTASVRLERDSRVVEIKADLFRELIRAHPSFLDHLSRLVDQRQRANQELAQALAQQKTADAAGGIGQILRKIKSALGL
ncbi:MscS Mechanosensitive ion channel [Desulfarculus baarsii DSM 2075]|uniref:MscS Mechanosensitive ion channel n=1 Tax=Desulfarculus baarsii (strain ATCC 33931 / DSM 2075 / LMG 7858 / VKM B-1802 / 2st14) TaxID=644282 RepID=E1QH75_DESB2|nr:MscS Mechanosensitive ion channel [Desulfarculus baarsii DSM 2075]